MRVLVAHSPGLALVGADGVEGLEAVFFDEPMIRTYPEAGMGSMLFWGLENFSPGRVAWIEALFPKRRG